MKNFENFNINDPMHVSILGYASDLALNETLYNAKTYLQDRFEVAPLKALEALFAHALGHKLTSLQSRYVSAYQKAEKGHIDKNKL